MIKPNHKYFYKCFFTWYIQRLMKKHFSGFEIKGDILKNKGSILLIGNHFSWWDGFIAWEVNRKLLKKKFFILMLEDQLKKFRFFSYLGAFSIKKHNRDALESIRFGSQILTSDNNLLVIFPQGEIASQHQTKLVFQNGWYRMLNGSNASTGLMFMVNLVDYFSSPKPRLTVYLKSYEWTVRDTADSVFNAYNDFYQECKQKQLP